MPTPSWPCYFAKWPLNTERMVLREGDPFPPPYQDKALLRGLAHAYGVKNVDKLAFNELPYVRPLNVRSQAMLNYILQTAMTYEDAKALLEAPPVVTEAA